MNNPNKKFTIIGMGEVLWDLLPDGKILGGAPVNFAYHAMQLGAVGVAISSVGDDELGREIMDSVNSKGVKNCIAVNSHPTGTVGVTLKDGKPDYTIYENVAWDFIELTPEAIKMIQQADAICFGTLAQRSAVSHEAILKALKLVPENCLKVYDINLRQKYYSKELISESLSVANVFKINDDEVEIFKYLFGLEGSETEVCQKIKETYSLKYLALTKGEKGSYLFFEDEVTFLPTPLVVVEDTIGAGDSFTSAMVMGILNKQPLQQIHRKAVEISAFVCTQKGATPVLPEKILA
ncbi:carbohydrate kinase [bacterium]|nr:carbohydrate kinase [bacterium]